MSCSGEPELPNACIVPVEFCDFVRHATSGALSRASSFTAHVMLFLVLQQLRSFSHISTAYTLQTWSTRT